MTSASARRSTARGSRAPRAAGVRRAGGIPAGGTRAGGIRSVGRTWWGRGLRLGVAAVVPTAVLLAGCSGVEAGSAATVGSSSISESSLQDNVESFIDSLPASEKAGQQADLAQVQTGILSSMVVEKVVSEVAAARGVTVTPAQIAAKVAADIQGGGAQLESQLIPLYLTRATLSGFEQTNLQFVGIEMSLPGTKGQSANDAQATTLAYIKAQATKLPVRVSPRYGVWDVSKLSLSGGPQSISTAGPTATTAPTA